MTLDDLPERIRQASRQTSALLQNAKAQRLTLGALEQAYIVEVLREAGGSKSRRNAKGMKDEG